MPAQATELTYDNFGGPEQVAILIPCVVGWSLYTEWFRKQPIMDMPLEEIKGETYLGKTVDGEGESAYFRRSPEAG